MAKDFGTSPTCLGPQGVGVIPADCQAGRCIDQDILLPCPLGGGLETCLSRNPTGMEDFNRYTKLPTEEGRHHLPVRPPGS